MYIYCGVLDSDILLSCGRLPAFWRILHTEVEVIYLSKTLVPTCQITCQNQDTTLWMFTALKVSYLIHLHIHTLFFIFVVAAVYVMFILSNTDSISRDILKFNKLTGKCVKFYRMFKRNIFSTFEVIVRDLVLFVFPVCTSK